jgi:tripartite-type tricarboxylate transporter receptor subunit TctC
MISRRTMTWRLAATLASPATTALAATEADAWPTRPISFVVPFPAGNVTDVLARLIAQGLSARLGVPVLVDNRPGAAGIIGSQYVANAKPDGYTMLYGSSGPMASHVSYYRKLPYSPLRSFVAVNGVTANPFILVVPPDRGWKKVDDFVAYLKQNPGKASFGSPGQSTGAHLVGELFQVSTGTKMTHIPYKESSTLYSDLLAGRIDAVFDFVPVMRPNIETHRVVALAAATEERIASLPQVPTFREQGHDIVFLTWSVLMLPAGTPAAVVRRMSTALREAMKTPEIVKYLKDNESVSRTALGPAELPGFLNQQIEVYAGLIKKAGVQAE